MISLLTLPREVLNCILCEVDPADFATVSLCCKELYSFFKNNNLLHKELYLRHWVIASRALGIIHNVLNILRMIYRKKERVLGRSGNMTFADSRSCERYLKAQIPPPRHFTFELVWSFPINHKYRAQTLNL